MYVSHDSHMIDMTWSLHSIAVDELLITLLDSSKLELVYATCGVLVNVTGDPKHKSILEKNQGVTK